MARQKVEDHLFYLIFRQVPTWTTVTVVAMSYPVLRWLLPVLTHNNLSALVLSAFAPWLTFALMLIALYAEGDKYRRRRLLSQQNSLDTLQNMTWLEFEHLVGEVYRRQRYKVEEKGGSGPDGGVDLVLRRDGETVLVQCKQWKTQQVGVSPVRELRGVVARDKATRGIFVTSSTFTREAYAEAQGQPLELVDGAALLELVKQAQGRVAPLDTTQAPMPANEAPSPVPLCPNCGSAMKRKTARQGPNTGSEFWGCPTFPHCRGTRQI